MRLRWAFPLLLLTSTAVAQSPSPAQMGITHSIVPEVLQVLNRNKAWVKIGEVQGGSFMVPQAQGGTGVSNPNLTAGSGVSITGTWPNQTITSANVAGFITLVAGTATYTFAVAYPSAPICLCQQVPSGPAVPATDACTAFETTANVTFTGNGVDTIKYHCLGRNF